MTGYYVDMITPLQTIPQKFNEWITSEICEGGLLEEIDQYCTTYRTAGSVQSYEIWVKKEDWSIDSENSSFTRGDSYLVIDYPFTVAIIVDMIDEETSEDKAIQLQAKTIMSILKNYNPLIFDSQDDGFINYFSINEGYNDGSLEALNREDDVIIKGFNISFSITIDWLECYRKHEIEQETNNGGTDNG